MTDFSYLGPHIMEHMERITSAIEQACEAIREGLAKETDARVERGEEREAGEEQCPPDHNPETWPATWQAVVAACEERAQTQGDYALEREGNWAQHAGTIRALAAERDELKLDLEARDGVADAFESNVQYLQQRADAAEAALAELRKQPVVRLPTSAIQRTALVRHIRCYAVSRERHGWSVAARILHELADAIEQAPTGEAVVVTREQWQNASNERLGIFACECGECQRARADLSIPEDWLSPAPQAPDASATNRCPHIPRRIGEHDHTPGTICPECGTHNPPTKEGEAETDA